MNSDKVMAEYNAARRALTPTVRSGDVCWSYRNGWYRIGYGKYRRSDVEKMTQNLRERAVKDTAERDDEVKV